MTPLSDNDLKNRTLNKIRFLEEQLTSLDHYLPETYEFLLQKLDHQKRILAELEVLEHFNHIDQSNSCHVEPSSP